MIAIATALLAAGTTSACSLLPRSWTRQTDFGRGDLHSENPIVQVRAMHQIVERREVKAVPDLIALLQDSDPSVRDNADWALGRLCGRDRPGADAPKYHFYDLPEERARAAADWKAYCAAEAKP